MICPTGNTNVMEAICISKCRLRKNCSQWEDVSEDMVYKRMTRDPFVKIILKIKIEGRKKLAERKFVIQNERGELIGPVNEKQLAEGIKSKDIIPSHTIFQLGAEITVKTDVKYKFTPVKPAPKAGDNDGKHQG